MEQFIQIACILVIQYRMTLSGKLVQIINRGKQSYAAALALPGVRPMRMGDRPMVAMVELSPEHSADPALRATVLALALATVRALPPKVAKPAKR